jgi:hypothetical protein
MEKTARPAFPQALGEDVLEEPAEQLHDVEGGGAEAGTAHFAVGEGARAVRERDDTLGGDGDLADRRGEGGEGGVAVVMRLPGNVPGAKPALGIAMLSAPGLAHLFFAERTGEGRARLDRDKDVGTGGGPGRAVPGEAAAGHHVISWRCGWYWSGRPQVGRTPVNPGRAVPRKRASGASHLRAVTDACNRAWYARR